ncbi:MAG: hypothetical protein ACI835_001889 [Planctomycetota bacterium]|jgi:hypothetical protein
MRVLSLTPRRRRILRKAGLQWSQGVRAEQVHWLNRRESLVAINEGAELVTAHESCAEPPGLANDAAVSALP